MNSLRTRSPSRRAIVAALAACAVVGGAALAAQPDRSPVAAPGVAAPKAPAQAVVPAAAARPIDVNSALRAQLKTLPGIGDAEADKIIARRPFLTKAGLVEAGAIPAGTYLSIKHRIIAKQKSARPAKARPPRVGPLDASHSQRPPA